MTYLSKKDWKLIKFEKSHKKDKMYNAVFENKINKKIKKLPFGSSSYENYRDITGLNLYPHLIHGDKNRRRLYHARHKVFIKDGFWSPSSLSLFYLW